MTDKQLNVYSVSTYNLSCNHDDCILLEFTIPYNIEMKVRNIEAFANGIPHTLELIINPYVVPGTNKLIPVRHHVSDKNKSSLIQFTDNPQSIEKMNESLIWVIGDFNNIHSSGESKQPSSLNEFIFEQGVYILKLTNKSNTTVSMCLLLHWEELRVL